jgi:hypothetical protein
MKKEKIFLIKIGENYHLSTNKQTNKCYHLVFKEILDVNGVGEKSVEIHHNKGWNKPNEVLFIDTEAKLSQKNCDEIFGVIDIELMADFYGASVVGSLDFRFGANKGFENGFKKSIELNKDKRFTLEDVKKVIKLSREKEDYNFDGKDCEYKFQDNEIIQSLQQPTEIKVEIVTEEDFIFDPSMGISQGFNYDKQKLDSNGCLILKRK